MSPSLLKSFVLSKTLNHFQTFMWLRWRIRINQLRHGSSLGKALAAFLLVSFAMACVGLLVVGGVLGALVPRLLPREFYFLFWDGFIGLFCFIWVIHVATDIQRSDAITFDRILHLPVAFSQAFAINYLSSLMSMTLILLCVFCFGFIFGSCFSIGPIALLFPIPFVFFLVALTALTYQLQGWLAALMSNPGRRQMVMIFVPLCIIAISQIPAIFVTRFAKSESARARDSVAQAQKRLAPTIAESPPTPPQELPPALLDSENQNQNLEPTLDANPTSAEIAVEPSGKGLDGAEPPEPFERTEEDAIKATEHRLQLWVGRIRLVNFFVPPLWMAGCVESIMSGTFHVVWLTSAMAIVGFVSLRRNYRQTLRYYKGETDSRASSAIRTVTKTVRGKGSPQLESLKPVVQARVERPLLLVERSIPFVSEETAAIITMTLQSMTRAPEVKLYLLLPFIAPFILFGIMQAWQPPNVDEIKSAIVIAFSAFSLFMTSGMLGNCFGYDRAGFRAFVLSPIQRERILLGRNLANAPLLLLQTLILALAIGIFFGMAIDKILCAVILSAAILPLYSLLTNAMSILAPFPLAAGSIQPKQLNLVPVLFSLVLSLFMPAITVVALVPLGLEWILERFFPNTGIIPIAFLMSIPWLAASLFLYRWLLPWEGKLLANREKELLRVVTSKIE